MSEAARKCVSNAMMAGSRRSGVDVGAVALADGDGEGGGGLATTEEVADTDRIRSWCCWGPDVMRYGSTFEEGKR
jgi:hypothetical protein